MPEVLALVRNFLMQASNVTGLPTVGPLDSIDFGLRAGVAASRRRLLHSPASRPQTRANVASNAPAAVAAANTASIPGTRAVR